MPPPDFIPHWIGGKFELLAAGPTEPGERPRSTISLLAVILTALVLLGTYVLISPPVHGGYEGVIPWRNGSLLKMLTDAMSLGGAAPTMRGAEIKDLVLHLGAAAALLLLAARFLVASRWPSARFVHGGVALLAQVFLIAWVIISLASSLWAISPESARGQAALFGLALAWALMLAWCLLGRDIARALWAYLFVAALGILLCAWYFHERNPAHRPGFPIGNPSALASCTVPALLISASLLIGSIASGLSGQGWRLLRIALSAPLLGICIWGMQLTSSRGALVGLAGGALGLLYVRGNRGVRIALLLIALAVGGAAGWLWSEQKTDMLGARGDTLRFRAYAWRYAAVLWGQRPFGGWGAGSYPALAGTLAAQDRLLDPAAFYGELVEHAHNELFEVFAEIGLFGGITFVAGVLATLAAASALVRANVSPTRRWLHYGLVAGVLGALVDAMFGVGLRLPGMPAVFFTLLGILWAACRALAKTAPGGSPLAHPRAQLALAGLALICAPIAATLGTQNWLAARAEHDATVAASHGQLGDALTLSRLAGRGLLDPVRRIAADEQAVGYAVQIARGALQNYAEQRDAPGTSESVELDSTRSRVIQAGEVAWRDIAALLERAPALIRLQRQRAYCAAILADAWSRRDRNQSTNWWNEAWLAWATLHQQRPSNAEACVALTRFPLNLTDAVGLLRDALRDGFPRPDWFDALARISAAPGFTDALGSLVASVGTRDAGTYVDDLILSGAPEMVRLDAIVHSRAGENAEAAQEAGRAAEMYATMRSRYPELRSVALAEQAEYLFRDVLNGERSAMLIAQAIDALPAIQADKRRALARPYEMRAARYAFALGNTAAALSAIRAAAADTADSPESLQAEVLTDLAETFRQCGGSRAQIEYWIVEALRVRPDFTRAWLLRAQLASQRSSEEFAQVLRSALEAGVPAALVDRWRQTLSTAPRSQPSTSQP